MNIMTQVCGFIILIIIFFSYNKKKRSRLSTEKLFNRMWVVSFISLTLDILSLVLIYNKDVLPLFIVELVCKLYLCSLEWVAIISLLYLCADICDDLPEYRKMYYIFSYLGVAISVIMLVLDIDIIIGEGIVVYTAGPSVNVAYSTVALWIISILVLTNQYKNYINSKRRHVMYLWGVLWILAAAAQLFIEEVLIVGFAGTVGVLILYMELENPEINLDKRTGLFNKTAFLQYVKEKSNLSDGVSVLWVDYAHNYIEHYSGELDKNIKLEIVHFMSTIKNTMVFKGSSENIKFVFESPKEAEAVINIINERLKETWGGERKLQVGIQMIYLPDVNMLNDSEDVSNIFKYADVNKKEAEKGRLITIDQKLVFDYYDEVEAEKYVLKAIRDNKVEVFYQPIFGTQLSKFVSAEGLARIKKEDGTYMMPGLFIRIAENTGLIVKLGEQVFDNVCRFISEHNMEELGLECIDVNLSVIQCGYENLAKDFIRIMEKYSISPKYINLEITESESLSNKEILLKNMSVLREYGVKFSLDDFGTGQSNLNYIAEMPVDIVKFDRHMTQSYFESNKAKYVMDAAIMMIMGMQLKIVSEGIETKEQYDVVEGKGIHFVQGYYFSKPLQEGDFVEFIKKYNVNAIK